MQLNKFLRERESKPRAFARFGRLRCRRAARPCGRLRNVNRRRNRTLPSGLPRGILPMRKRPVVLALLALLVLLPALAGAQGLRDRLQHAREASRQERPVAVPAGGTAIRNVAYGPDPAQRFDVYLPARAANAPVVFYVRGGGWANGDKTNPGLADKLAHWLPKGYAVVSSNYRMLPEAMPQEQARDIARAATSTVLVGAKHADVMQNDLAQVAFGAAIAAGERLRQQQVDAVAGYDETRHAAGRCDTDGDGTRARRQHRRHRAASHRCDRACRPA